MIAINRAIDYAYAVTRRRQCSLEDDPTEFWLEVRVMLFAENAVQTLGASITSSRLSCLSCLCWVVDESGGIDELAGVVVEASNSVNQCDWWSPGDPLAVRRQILM